MELLTTVNIQYVILSFSFLNENYMYVCIHTHILKINVTLIQDGSKSIIISVVNILSQS